jgi:WD40 repeat protein
MCKTFPFMITIALFIIACGGADMPVPTLTSEPSPTRVPTMTVPSLVREIKLETRTGTAYTLAWSPDGETLAVASGGEITLLSADLQETLTMFRPEGGALGVTWNPDMTQFATVNGFRNPTITVWDLDTAAAELTLAEELRAGTDQYGVSWSLDGKMLATLAGDSKSVIQIWDTAKWEEIHTFDLPYTKPRRAIQWSSDSSKMYGAGEADGQMIVFALNVIDGTVRETGKYRLTEGEVFAVSPREDRMAISDARGVVQIYDIASGRALTGIKSVDQPVDIAWNPQGETLAILDYRATLQLWDVSQ